MPIRSVLRSPLRSVLRPTIGEGVGGALASLFANGEDGFLFGGFADLTRQFLISTGATGNIAANDDPVGLLLDNRSWGNGVSTAAMLAAQTELFVAGTTADNSSAPSTTTESPAGTINLTGDGSNNARRDFSFASVSGSTYRVVFTASGGTVNFLVGTVLGGSTQLNVTASAGANEFFVLAGGATTYLRWLTTAVRTVTGISVKRVPGKHVLQATTTKRPLWKANSGKPFLSWDGTDDFLQSAYVPGAAGTMAVAFKTSTTGTFALAGGTATGNKRARMGLGTGGRAEFAYNTTAQAFDAVDHRNVDTLMIQTWGGGVHRAYVDGVLLVDEAVAANMDGAGTGYALGAIEGGTSGFLLGGIYAALVRSTLSTPSEIALITREFQSTYQ